MSAIPADVDADQGPPTAVPLAHFLVGLGFLFVGVLVVVTGPPGRSGTLAATHLLLAGWVCVTILGAMTQFVPVWSGVTLHSRRLSVLQLVLVTAGITGLAGAFLTGRATVAPLAGFVAACGFWTFVYNLGRTLARVEGMDVTERHFAVALGWFLLVTVLGPVLALDLAGGSLPTGGVLPLAGVDHTEVLRAHATMAVFGAVLTTVVGALYQLATMFTQTELGPVERRFQRVETVAFPLGVAGLAAGRVLSQAWLARAGGLVVAMTFVGIGIVLANRCRTTRVDWTPMLTRYAVVAVVAVAWGSSALVGWWTDPLGNLYGHPVAGAPLLAALVGFVVAGTLYHIVPFLVWVEEYSDRLGFEPVPLVDDLYDGRVARVEGGLLLAGGGLFVVRDAVAFVPDRLGAACVLLGVMLFVANLALVVVRHGGFSAGRVLDGGS